MRKLLRHLVMQHSSIPEWDESPAPTKLHLLVQAAAGQQPQPSFVPKRGLSINTRKAFQVRMLSTSLPLVSALMTRLLVWPLMMLDSYKPAVPPDGLAMPAT